MQCAGVVIGAGFGADGPIGASLRGRKRFCDGGCGNAHGIINGERGEKHTLHYMMARYASTLGLTLLGRLYWH